MPCKTTILLHLITAKLEIYPAKLRSLQRLLRLENKKVDYMIISGYALPFYGRIRTTIDFDLAVETKAKKNWTSFAVGCDQTTSKSP
jgi:hypothetical protein